jgi:hypothetical protein
MWRISNGECSHAIILTEMWQWGSWYRHANVTPWSLVSSIAHFIGRVSQYRVMGHSLPSFQMKINYIQICCMCGGISLSMGVFRNSGQNALTL